MLIHLWVGPTPMVLRPDLSAWAVNVLDYVTEASQDDAYVTRSRLLGGVSVEVVANQEAIELFTSALIPPEDQRSTQFRVTAMSALPSELWRSSPISYGDLDGRGEVKGSDSGRYAIAWNSGQFILTIMDRQAGSIGYIKEGGFPASERGGPLRTPAHWLASETGSSFLHAAAIDTGRGAVLIGGPSGAGKSTFSQFTLAGDSRIIGDDYVVAVSGAGGYTIEPAYRTIKTVGEEPLAQAQETFALDNGKSAHILGKSLMSTGAPLRACTIVDPAGPQVPETADPAWVARTLATSTILQVPMYAEDLLSSIVRMTTDVPCYRIGWVGTRAAAHASLQRVVNA